MRTITPTPALSLQSEGENPACSRTFSQSKEHDIHRSRHNKAINGERDKRNALNQLQEGFNRYQRHHKSGDKPNGKHRDIAGCQEAPAFVEIERRCAHHHRYRQQERELGSSVTAHAHQHPT
ncbi:hypothetical protein DP20_3550 [Shigella flexneri]|nr:hypothetical protein DP20_3550 [Shigella flexneri]